MVRQVEDFTVVHSTLDQPAHWNYVTNRFDAMSNFSYQFTQVCFHGHTHVPVLEDVGGMLLMNPGSPAIPKYEANGEPIPTVGLITDSGAKIINITDGSTLIEKPG